VSLRRTAFRVGRTGPGESRDAGQPDRRVTHAKPTLAATLSGEGAWVSAVSGNTDLSRSFSAAPAPGEPQRETLLRLANLQERMARGEAIAAGEIGRVWHHRNAWPFSEDLPRVILTGWIALRRDVAEVFSRFDLARGRLHPVDLVEHDGATLISSDYAVLSPGNAIEAFDPARSSGLKRMRFLDREFFVVQMPAPGEQPHSVLTPGFTCVPDVWIDPRVMNGLCLSDRLVTALRSEGLDAPFALSVAEPR
jgi:hypothetical protein